jgi:hypothetical protein
VTESWNTARRGELLRELAGRGLLDRPRFLESAELGPLRKSNHRIDAAIEGEREVAARTVRLRIGLGERFPHDLPSVYVAELGALPFLPHVERDGRVCYVQREGVVVEASAPDRVVEEAFDRALQTIEDGLIGRNAREIYDELEAYWRELDGANSVPGYVDPNGPLRKIIVAFARDRGRVVFPYVADNFAAVSAFDPTIKRLTSEKIGLFIPLARSVLDERLDPRSFTDGDWVRAFVERHLTRADGERLRSFAASREELWPFVVLSVPRPQGGRSLVGLHYEQAHGGHPLLDGRAHRPVRPICLTRRDRRALLERGGAATNLGRARVAIIGCGAVGGHVAMNLASAGVASLCLVDPDHLSTENTFRHVLGRSSRGRPKAVAMKHDIQRRYPFVAISAEAKRIEELMTEPGFDWQQFSLVVITIGDVTVSRMLNENLARAHTAAIFTWLEPLGIGGHALLAHLGEELRGCYDCLFWDGDGQERLANRADFAAPGQSFTRDVAGCGSVFTPYGNLDASRTAELAARLALSALSGSVLEAKLVSWRGDPAAFHAAHYRLSDRWNVSASEPFPLAQAACQTCWSSG